MTPADLSARLRELMAEATPGLLKLGPYATDLFVHEPKNGEPIAKLFDVRGWGYLTGKGGGLGLSDEDAVKVQRANGTLVQELWNNAATILRLLESVDGAEKAIVDEIRSEAAPATDRHTGEYVAGFADGRRDAIVAVRKALATLRAAREGAR